MASPGQPRWQLTGFASVGLIGHATDRVDLARLFLAAGLSVLEFEIPTGPKADANSAVAIAELGRLSEPDALIVCSLAMLTSANGADITALTAAIHAICEHLRHGQFIVLTGTIPPGMTRSLVLPLLVATGLVEGRDFFLAFSPEPDTQGIPRVVGGLDTASTDAAEALFRRAGVDVRRVSSLEVAEMCGSIGAVLRSIQAAAANELRVACGRMGMDVWEVLTASGVQSIASTLGDCDSSPLLLAWGTRRYNASFRLVELAGEINARMLAFVVDEVTDALNDVGKPVKGSKIAILGLVSERDLNSFSSPSFKLMDLLLKKGAVVSYNDPHIPRLPQMMHWPHLPSMEAQLLTSEYLMAQDCILITRDHAEYVSDFIVQHSRLIIDTCNAMKGASAGREKIVKV